jgi:hypothetical protein
VDAFMGVAYVISDLYQAPPVAAQTEEFWARMHP